MREELRFASGSDQCAAWLYRPEGTEPTKALPCVVMAHGFSLTRHDGLPAFAEAFAEAGLAVLVFDHRYLGDSGGEPRQRFRKADQLEDWRSAIAFARSRPELDPERIVLWGYSFSAGHVVTIAAEDARLAAALALCPFVNGLPRVLKNPPRQGAWILPRAIADAMGRHTTVPVTAEPGEHGAMTFEGEARGFASAVAEGSPWRNSISPGLFLTVAAHRPMRLAPKIGHPLWVGLGERDITVDKRSIERLATRAPDAELHRYDADHFEPFDVAHQPAIAADQVEFLRRLGLAWESSQAP